MLLKHVSTKNTKNVSKYKILQQKSKTDKNKNSA